MKYDNQISELKSLLPNTKNVLIALPAGSDTDKLAAGLALYLSLKQAGKDVSIVTDETVKVAQSHLFGVDKIQNTLPQAGSSNFMVTLESVASPDGTIPALEKLDWYPEGGNLNLVFHTLPGQSFQPTNVVPKYPAQNSGFNVIFIIGANSLNNLGNIYSSNIQVFTGVYLVNIDNQVSNTNFGQTNVVDQSASAISEIMTDLIPSLGLPINADTASNLLAGIFDATNNLTNQKVNPDTYLAVGSNMKSGGKKPVENTVASQPTLDLSAFIPKTQPATPGVSTSPSPMDFTMPPVMPSQSTTPSPEDLPAGRQDQPIGEAVTTPEPGWLTPKVFKGSSIG